MRLLTFAILVLVVFLVGCAEKAVEPIEPKPIQPKTTMPKLADVPDILPEPVVEPVIEPEVVDTSMKSLDDKLLERDVKPIGTRLHETEGEEIVAVEGDLVMMNEDKRIDPEALIITVGTTVTWKNNDVSPHMVLLEQDGERILTGDRFEAGQSYSYTFNQKGAYDMRDMFSGSMHGTIEVK